jgi:hypothetical protein
MPGKIDFVNVSIAGQKSKLAGEIRGSFFVVKGEY